MIWFVVPFMTYVSRMAGGGWPKLPYGLDAWILAAPYLLFYPAIGLWILPAYLGAVLGIRLGHGRFFQYKQPFKAGSEPEKIEFLIDDTLPVYWQKFMGMALTGFAVTLTLGFILNLYGFIAAGLIVWLSGALKAIAYMLPETWHSELLRGAFLGLGVALAYGMI